MMFQFRSLQTIGPIVCVLLLALAKRQTLCEVSDEVPIDYTTGRELPKEMNDGELEGGDQHSHWNYLDQHSWVGQYPLCKGQNMRQSPIDIKTDEVTFKPVMRLEFIDYDQEVEFQLKNTHHSVSMTLIPSVSVPTVRLNWIHPDTSDYELQEIHFHWGDGLVKGSEHEINDEKAAAEMHMVHYRKGIKKDDIGNVDNSVVVIAVLIESDVHEHNKLEGLVKKAEAVNGTDTEYIDKSPENLINLLPDSHHSFYTYNGSLTTPPCYEVVTWVIMSEPVHMEQDKLVELSNMEVASHSGRQKIRSNHRDIQPLLNRPVYVSFNVSESITSTVTKPKGKFKAAFDEYWSRINRIRTSVRKAFSSVAAARNKLLLKIGRDQKPQQEPEQQQQEPSAKT